jgi:hypothetical protein
MGFGVTGEAIKGVAQGVFSSAATDAQKARADHVFNGRYAAENYSDAATAGTAVTETVHCQITETSAYVKKIRFTAPIAVTANGSNFATITVSKRTAAGAAVTLGTFSTSATSMVAFVPADLTLTAANLKLAAGDVITVAISKTGTGVALTAATSNVNVTVYFAEDD